MNQNISMDQKSQELTQTIWTDTQKMRLWQDAIKLAIWSDWNSILESNQISVKLDKREKDLAKKRSPKE